MRRSGILMHISSLPSPYGIGTLGKCAYDFVDFLASAGQTVWQMLPIGPTGYGNSPYSVKSSFAGNHYFIDLDLLIQQGLLQQEEVDAVNWGADPTRVDYGALYRNRRKILYKAFSRFQPDDHFVKFVKDNRHWLDDYALFMALKEKFNDVDWQNWSLVVMLRLPAVMSAYQEELADSIEFHRFLQYLFFTQWKALRRYAHDHGVLLAGDVPVYVPLDSADVWQNPYIFQLDQSRRPRSVTGFPPTSFNENGQVWGHPLYDWDKMRKTSYDWWIKRLKAASRMFDIIRLDHFRGFESYWSIPVADRDPAKGSWIKGPGMDFIATLRTAIPKLKFIAEDVGDMPPEVVKLREDSGYPGMKVLQYSLDSRGEDDTLPRDYPENTVCYSSTHDNPTMVQWLQEASDEDREHAMQVLGLNSIEGLVWGTIRACMDSPSGLCIVQMQDYLELGAESRMNKPGVFSGDNWVWRATPGYITPRLTERIHETTRRGGRIVTP